MLITFLILLIMAIPMLMRMKLEDEDFRSKSVRKIYQGLTTGICVYIGLNLAMLGIDYVFTRRIPVLFVIAQVYLLVYLIVMRSEDAMYDNTLHRTYTVSALIALLISAFAH